MSPHRFLLAFGLLATIAAVQPGTSHAQGRVKASKVNKATSQRAGIQKSSKTSTHHRPHREVTRSLRVGTTAKSPVKSHAKEGKALVDGLAAIHAKKIDGISIPHADVIKQIESAAGGKIDAPVYVIRYGTPAAEQVTALAGQGTIGLMYKGSAGNGHSMVTVGEKFTDSVPGRHSFSNGEKTRLHDFKPMAERPQITALFALPKSVMPQAVEHAKGMAAAKKSCGADCAGYVREIAVKTSDMAKDAGSADKVTNLSKALGSYQAPTRMRNTSFAHADAIILMVSPGDWRNPNNAGYNINDWNKKK